MSALFRFSVGAVAVGLCCLPLGAVRAQQATNRSPGEIKPAQAQSDASNPTGQNRATSSQIDRSQPGRPIQGRQPYSANYRGTQANNGQNSAVEMYLANCLLKRNQGEIEISQFAAEQSQNPKVKQFAQELAKDHQQVVEKLQQIAGARGVPTKTSSLDTSARPESDRPATRTPGESATDTGVLGQDSRTNRIGSDRETNESVTTGRTATQGSGALQQLASIEEKIADRCEQALREELQQKSGAEFDQCFVGAQVGGHMQMLAALDVISQDTQGPLKQIAEEAKPTVQKHLDHAKGLAKQLMSGEQGSAQAQRPSTSRTERQ
jgi:predicted outer membrane protein